MFRDGHDACSQNIEMCLECVDHCSNSAVRGKWKGDQFLQLMILSQAEK